MSNLQGSQGRGFQGDARQGVGYGGIASAGFHEPRQSASSFPYTDPDEYDEEDEELVDDDMIDAFVAKINGDYVSTDSERHKGNDPFYFVGANTRLVSCFLRADDVLLEVETIASKLGLNSPIGSSEPILKRSGGRKRLSPGPKTGSKKGYFSPHPKPTETDLEHVPTPDMLDHISVWDLDDAPSDDERALIKIRNAIDSIHMEQEATR